MKSKLSSGSRNGPACFDAACGYASFGFRVVPVASITGAGHCSCGRRNCSASGKHPIISGWRREASNDPDVIRRWWRRWPHANVGIATGKMSNVIVVDIDPRHGGDASLKELEAALGELPKSVRVRTGGGGLHIYLRQPGFEIRNSAGIAPGVDIRGDGGLVVAPPSRHVSGGLYEWIS